MPQETGCPGPPLQLQEDRGVRSTYRKPKQLASSIPAHAAGEPKLGSPVASAVNAD